MKLALPKSSGRQAAIALVITMLFLAVALMAFAGVMYWATSNSTVIARNNLFNQASAAAESATEVIISTLQRDARFQALSAANSYTTILPDQTGWPVRYQFSDTNGTANRVSVSISTTNWSILDAQFRGLYGLGQTCVVTCAASPTNASYALSARVQQQIWFGTIPVFQYAVFYNLDCEINPGSTMTINGHVHSNGNLWTTGASSSSPLTYSDLVESSLTFYNNRRPNDPNGTRTGGLVFQITTNNPLSSQQSLNLPIGTNNSPGAVSAILNVPPTAICAPNAAAYYESNQVYFYNEADLIVSNAPSGGTNIFVFYQNQSKATILTPVLPDATNITVVSGKSVTNVFYSYLTNVSFYDYRESDTVKALQIDVAKFSRWLTNQTPTGGYQYNYANDNNSSGVSKGHQINSIYVYNGIQPAAGVLPAVRLVNGQELPHVGRLPGLTVVTPQPLYVKGNYNVTTNNGVTQALTLGSTTNNAALPAALIADAVTILSSNWNDTAYTSGTALSSRTPITTTINAACLEGIVPTQQNASGNWQYSGGLENFLRLLENWGASGVNLNYNGSIVVMFTSQYATNYWNGNVYGVPRRNWGFDENYKDPSRLPPLTPSVKATIRTSYRSW